MAQGSENWYGARFRFGRRRWRLRWQRVRATARGCRQLKDAVDLTFLVLDALFLYDLSELLRSALTPGLRGLRPAEIALLRPIFGDSVPYALIRLDERAHLGPRTHRICYVNCFTINSWGPMHPATLVHEVVHVWQYVHRGAAYIPRALRAQWSEMGYNYGGLPGLAAATELEDFNYEQMADVIEDGFRLSGGYRAQWVPGRGAEVLPAFFPFLDEVRAAVI